MNYVVCWLFEIKPFLFMAILAASLICRAYFRKAGHAFRMDKKGHYLINLGQLEY